MLTVNLWCAFVFCWGFFLQRFASSLEVTYSGPLYVLEGAPFSIACLRSSFGAPKWTKDGQDLRQEDGFAFETEPLEDRLLLMKVRAQEARWSHRGRYKCDGLSERDHRIEVVPLEESEPGVRQVKLRPGYPLQLHCEKLEKGDFPINWYKDGHRLIESEDDPRIRLQDRRLRVHPATTADSGEYLCVVEVSGLSHPVAQHPGRIFQVTYGARVENFPPQIRPIINRTLSVECKVQGFPAPLITWFVDDVPLTEFQRNNTRFRATANGAGLPFAMLVIANATWDDDGHVVRCSANNSDGSAHTSALLAVRGEWVGTFSSAKKWKAETILNTNEEYPGKGIILTPGTDLILQCNVTDERATNVKWLKDSLAINLTDSRIHIENHNNTLVIDKATEKDTGNYTCISSDNSNVTITVRSRVRLSPFHSSLNVVQGQNILLTCNVSQGMPLPVLQWFKNQEPLNVTNDRISIVPKTDSRGESASVLTISDAEFDDRAEYMCIATGDLNTVNTTILVRVKNKYAALWPFLGICAEVAVLCTVIFIYEKKRQKPDFDESEADHNTENKSVPDQEDKSREVRQRK